MANKSIWQSFKSAAVKGFDTFATGTSAANYGMKTLELKAFMLRASVITDAINDSKVRETLQNVVVSEEDSDNIKTFLESVKLHNQSINPATTVASNLNRH